MTPRLRTTLIVFALLTGPRVVAAQDLHIRGFVGIDWTRFTASQSFDTILGTSTLPAINGGGEVVWQHIFGRIDASRYRKQGERVFIFNDEPIALGIENTITITPLQLTGGYRFGSGRVIPYAGAGVGWYRYQETDEFSDDSEAIDERFTGYHLLGGAEVAITPWVAVAGEAQWSTVKDALGQNPNSVSEYFDETDLGGATVRVKVVVGF